MFPVAWGIVSCEDEESWKFFIWHLKHVLEPSNRGDNWCIISDKQKVTTLITWYFIDYE